MRVTLRYVHEYRDRHGKIRRYVRLPGRKKTPLPGEPGSLEFIAAYQTAIAMPRTPVGIDRNSPGSVASWVSLYLAAATFAALAPDTRRTRKNLLERFRAKHGEKPAALLTGAHIEVIISKYSPVVARNFLKALRPWMHWCVKQGLRQDNPMSAVERPEYKSAGYNTWPERYVEQFRRTHAIGTRARLAFELLVNTGVARADVVRMGKQHVRDGFLLFRRHKTGVPVEIPILPPLRTIFDQYPTDNLTFLLTEYGKPFSDAGFGNWFRECCNKASIPNGYSAHGIRKYAATEHANLGASAHQLMSWFGWLTIREAEHYTRAAERRRLAASLGRMVNQELANRSQVSQSSEASY